MTEIVTVSPTGVRNTHHLSLTDGTTTVGLIITDQKGDANSRAITRTPVNRTAMKTTTGNQKYDDFEPPWSPVAQSDWSGGMGLADFDLDTTRYLDNRRTNPSMVGKIILGGLAQYMTGIRKGNAVMPGSVTWSSLIPGTTEYLANLFTATDNYTAGSIAILVKRLGTPAASITVELCSDNAGVPGTVLKTLTISTTNIPDTVSEFWHVDIAGGQAIASGSSYWVKVYSSGGTATNCWKVGVSVTAGNTKQCADNATWVASLLNLYYRAVCTNDNPSSILAQYLCASAVADTVGDLLTAGNITNGSLETMTLNTTGGYATDPVCYVKVPNTANSAAEAITLNSYFRMTLTPVGGNFLNLSSLAFTLAWASAGGSARGCVLRSSLDNYATNIATATITTQRTTWTNVNFDLTAGAYQNIAVPVTFRIYFWSNYNASRDLDIDTITFSGSVHESAKVFKPFQYRGSQYLVMNYGWIAGTSLWINGDHGTADANTGAFNTLIDASKNWTVDEFAGCVVKIIRGSGYAEETVYRTIVSNTATVLTVTPSWKIAHDTTTEYAILGSNAWREIAGHGLTVAVTDVLVVNNLVYFCQGDSVAIRSMKWDNNAGAERYRYYSETTAGSEYAVYLETVRSTAGTMSIWRGQNNDANSAISVSVSAVKAYGTDLAFATALAFTDSWGRINGLKEYDNKLWIGREGTIYAATGTVIDEIKLDEIHTAMDTYNGQAMMTHNSYLYFNLGAGMERYLNGVMDDVGPNRDEGLPLNRRGIISALVGYQGRYFASIDGGDSNYSSVLMNNGTGWSEVYRTPMPGQRIQVMQYQAIPGTVTDRLYINSGDDILWLPFPSQTLDPYNDPNYPYVWEGTLTSGYIYVGMVDAYKFFRSLKIFSENLSNAITWVEADYRLDNDTAWTPIVGNFDTSPIQEQFLLANYGRKGKRIQYRLRLQTSDYTKTPKIKTTVVENVSQVTIKYAYGFQFRVQDDEVNLLGNPEGLTAEEKLTILDAWTSTMTPLFMRSVRTRFDSKTVFIDPAALTPLAETSDFYAPRISAIEI